MSLKLQIFGVCIVSLLGLAAADGHLVPAVKWRACEGFATNIKYITGINVSYTPSWATVKEESALLNPGMTSDDELEAACDALLEDGQVGEIYTMKPENCNNRTNCLRMAVYPVTEAGLLLGIIDNPGDQMTWVCGKGVPPPTRPACPTPAPTPVPTPPSSTLQSQAKWRACDGVGTNVMYVTGTAVDYAPSWAADTSKNQLLDAGKTSSAELQAACDALLSEGQVGEIYQMDPDNCDGKTDCLRMAIYPITEEGRILGTISDTGSQQKWVCGKGAMPPMRPECPPTCGEIKDAYKASNCCGNPSAMFQMEGMRRLTPSVPEDGTAASLDHLAKALKRAKSESPAKASRLAQQVKNMLQEYV